MAEPAAHGAAWEPANGNLDNGGQITLGVRLINKGATPVDIGGVAFYAPATNTGTYTASVWETDTSDDSPPGAGTLLDSVAVAAAGIDAAAWNYFDVPLTLQPGTVYTAGVHTSSGRYVSNGADSLIAAIEGDDIRLIAANSDPNPPGLGTMFNGVFLDGANGYPTTAFQRTDYGIDVWLAEAIEPIDVAGAITIGEVVVAATLEQSLEVAGAVVVGEVVVSGSLLHLTPVSVAGAVTVGEVVVSGTVVHPETERPPGFAALAAMFRDARRDEGRRVRPVDCPYDGTLLQGARGVLHCNFCGRTY